MTNTKKTISKTAKKASAKALSQNNNSIKNGPNMSYLKNMAKQLNVTGYSKMAKSDLIHAIQLAEGNSDCYQRIDDCGLRECLFYIPCQPALRC